VFGAASLRGAFESMAAPYQAQSGVTLTFSFDASSALRTQIEQGAPADVFASADTRNAVALADEGMVIGDVVPFACNQLTIIVPAGNPAGITSPADLAKPGVKVVAAGEEVPITQYANQLVDNLGIAEGYEANIASREDNVAAVRSKIELGEGDAGVVYVTDAIASGDKVEQIPIPPEANVPATYAAVVVASTDQPEASQAYVDWLVGAVGQAIHASFGFLPAPTAAASTFTIDGLVDSPHTLAVADLQGLGQHSADVTFQAGSGEQQHSFTGVLLSDVVNLAGLTLDPDVKNDALHRYLVVSANDGYEVVISWGEVDPSFGNQPYLLAWEHYGAELTGTDGPVRLVTPGDVKGGRYVTGITDIEVRDIDSAPRGE
jgi:molybdate transport system substrate-binding protein